MVRLSDCTHGRPSSTNSTLIEIMNCYLSNNWHAGFGVVMTAVVRLNDAGMLLASGITMALTVFHIRMNSPDMFLTIDNTWIISRIWHHNQLYD